MSKTKRYQQHPNFKTAERNRAYFELLSNSAPKYRLWEWLLTILFYSTLHYVKAYLSLVHKKASNTITSHKAINTELSRLKRHSKIPKRVHRDYEIFRNYSRIARYHYLENYTDWNDPEFIRLVEVDCQDKFDQIRTFVLRELNKK